MKSKTLTKKKMQVDDDSSSQSEPKEAAMEMSEEVVNHSEVRYRALKVEM